MTKIQTLSIDLLRLDGDTQARIAIHEDTVDDYADLVLSEGDWPFDPIDVFHDGSTYFVADGFHRTLAAIRLKRASITCRVHNGTAKDAKIFGMTANDAHGLRMSRADKRACVVWLLDNGGKLTQKEIAEKAGVALRTVTTAVADRKSPNTQLAHSPSKPPGKPRNSSGKDPADEKAKADAKAKKDKERADAKAAKDKEKAQKKADADAAREKKKADAAAAKEKAKADKKAAREKAKEDAQAAKMAELPKDEQAKLIKNSIQQHIDKAARLAYDLNRVKKNISNRDAVVNFLHEAGKKLW